MKPSSPHEPDVAAQLSTVLYNGELLLTFPSGRLECFWKAPALTSVFVPVMNGGERLKRCLASLRAQTSRDFHVIIVDNCSTDNSYAFACSVAASDDRFAVVQNARNLGRIENWNRGMELCRGRYVKPVMVNDYLAPAALERLAAAMENHPSVVLARSSLTLVEAGKPRFLPLFPATGLIAARDVLRFGLLENNPAAGPTAQIWRRSAIQQLGLKFDSSLPWAADYKFALCLLEAGDFYYLREPLYFFEVTQRFATQVRPLAEFHDWIDILGKGLERHSSWLQPAGIEKVRLKFARLHTEYRGRTSCDEERKQLENMAADALLKHPLLSMVCPG